MKRLVLAYALMIAAAVAVFFVLRQMGETLTAPPPSSGAGTGPAAGGDNVVLHLLLALAAVIAVGRGLGRLLARLGQPRVIGEVIGGVLLGPSLLGAVFPAAYGFLIPPSIVPSLGIVAQIGVVLYMFLIGLELNPALLRGHVHVTVAASHASIVLPFVLGTTLALYLYPRLSTTGVPFTSFALFLGTAMSITAFPVLARILSELRMDRTRLGVIALACAAVDDVTAWCLLALVVGVVNAAAGAGLWVIVLTLAFIGLMFGVVRPVAATLIGRSGDRDPSRGAVAATIVAMLLSAVATEAIGVHAVFGAFLLGVVLPHDSPLARSLSSGIEQPVTILLLPAFFAFAGVRTEVGLLMTADLWLVCGLIVVVASVGKVGGALLAGRATGLSWRDAASLGVLMNTRGLMQLIVLNVGLDLGVITPTLFTMMVVMALVTTLATTPLVRRLASPEAFAPPDIGPPTARNRRTTAAAREAGPEAGREVPLPGRRR